MTATRDSERSTVGDEVGEVEVLLQDPHSVGGHARQIRHDATTLADEIRDAAADFERYFTDRMTQRRYSTLGAAVGVGYILGGGLRSRLTLVLLGAATRLAAALAVRELAERISPSDSTSVQSWRTGAHLGGGKERS